MPMTQAAILSAVSAVVSLLCLAWRTPLAKHAQRRAAPRAQALLSEHAAALRALCRLTSLHLQLPPEEALSLGLPQTAFITALTGLQDLALASGGISSLHLAVAFGWPSAASMPLPGSAHLALALGWAPALLPVVSRQS